MFVNQRAVDGAVNVAPGLVFTDLVDVSVDEVRALLLFCLHLGVFLHLALSELVQQVHVGEDLLHLTRVARDTLQNRGEIYDRGACIENQNTQKDSLESYTLAVTFVYFSPR